MNYIQKITKIRGRGQMTVPLEVRDALAWDDNEIFVKVETTSNGFKVEKLPVSHAQHPKKKLTKEEWEEIWNNLKRFSKSGKQHVNLTKFIRHDRDTHF